MKPPGSVRFAFAMPGLWERVSWSCLLSFGVEDGL